MADLLVKDASLTVVANAIRAKTGGSSPISFPDGFASEIGNLTDTSDATATEDKILSGFSAYGASGAKLNGNISSQAAQTITPTSQDQTIQAGKYLSGAQTIEGVVCTNLIPENIADGVTVKIGTATDDDSVALVVGTHQGGGAQPQLYAPTISISGRTLTITPNLNNGTFGDNFVLYDGANIVVTVVKSTTTINLDTYFSIAGTHSLSVKMTGTNFETSNSSNVLSYGLYTVSVSITDGSAVSVPSLISNYETATVTVEADNGYMLPGSISVSGASYTYDKGSGIIALRNVTGNVTISIVCPELIPDLSNMSWADISQISADGTAADYFDVGDRKAITLDGTVGTLALENLTEYVYIIGFDHNSSVEGTGISFGSFFTALENGVSVALCDSHYNSASTDGSKWFNMNHSGNVNTGGWKSCDFRYDILGSVEAKDQQNATSAAVTNPVENTLMAALPSELRAVLKPVTKYTDNTGGGSGSVEANVTATVDYLFLLAEKEIFGSISYANTYEGSHQAQYSYYASASKIKYNHSSTSSAVHWWERSPYASYSDRFCRVYANGSASFGAAQYSYGLSPAFVV